MRGLERRSEGPVVRVEVEADLVKTNKCIDYLPWSAMTVRLVGAPTVRCLQCTLSDIQRHSLQTLSTLLTILYPIISSSQIKMSPMIACLKPDGYSLLSSPGVQQISRSVCTRCTVHHIPVDHVLNSTASESHSVEICLWYNSRYYSLWRILLVSLCGIDPGGAWFDTDWLANLRLISNQNIINSHNSIYSCWWR